MPYFENIVSALDAPRNAANPVKIQRKFLKFILKSVPCLVNYNKNRFVIKDKNPPNRKNGAKGMYFCLWFLDHIVPIMHAIINANAKPFVPSHNPPTPINLMSPMPIGDCVQLVAFSNISPVITAMMYPNIAPIVAV